MDVVDFPDVRPQLPPPPDFRPTFSSRTRDLFRQKMRRRSSQLQQQLGEHLDKLPAHPQRPTKLPLMVLGPTASTAGLKCTTTQERKSPQKPPPPLLNPTTSWQQARKVATLSSRVPSSKSTSDVMEASPSVTPASQMECVEHATVDDDLDCSEVIFLPQSEPIPQQFWSMAQGWIPVVGRDIVACLFSRDWQLRESSIRRLSNEVAFALLNFDSSNMERLDRIWRCTSEMIAKAAEDKVYKVYSAAIKALKSLLAFTHFAPDLNYVQAGIRPIIYSILLKCADGQKRMAELSMETIHDLCRNVQVGSGATGQKQRSATTTSTMTLQGLDLIFQMIVEDKDPSWQFTMGRLVALEHVLTLMKVESAQAGIALDFSLHNLSNGHSRVAKMALKVFVLSAKLLTSSEPTDFEQVWKLILTLPDPTLQLTLRKKLKIALRSLPSPNYEMVNKIIDGHLDVQSPCSNTSVMALMSPPVPLIRSTSSSPSRSAGASKKTNKRHTPYGRRPAKNTTANFSHFPPPFKRTVSLKDDEVVKILPASSTYPCWTSSCPFDRPLPLVPSLSFHKSWHTTEDAKDSLLYSEGKQWSKSFMLGSGAFSTCFQARDVETGTLMAVKQIQLNRTGLQNEEEKVKLKILLQQEIDLMSMLDHPNLIRFYGVVEEAAQLNIFVEWMPGGSVARLLDKHGAFTENVILKYTQQILQGLSYLHSMGIIHRDLKGANLFVDNTGHHLRIGDFGAAACLYSNVTCPGEFRGQLQGTLAFMAPEVLRGESYGRSCDIWSLGCCIIEMATAKAPWNASDISNYYCLMYKIACSSDPPSLPPHLSRGLHNMASKCLQLSPENRPQAQQLLCHSLFAISDV